LDVAKRTSQGNHRIQFKTLGKHYGYFFETL